MLAESLIDSQAPEFSRLQGWLNSKPLTVEGLKGKVVLLDFWTFSCVNCIRSLPHMRRIHMMYGGDRFVLIGVHTPEFDFEKDPESVANAVKRFRLEYPVAIDSDNATWRLYGNQYWPRQTLIDAHGRVRWEHAGEGDYDKMEEQIRKLIKETGMAITNPGQNSMVDRESRSYDMTPEIYLGVQRSEGFGNGQICVPGSCGRYIDQGQHSRDVPYLSGDWTQFPEYVMHETHEPGYVLLKYRAKNANAVLGALKMKAVRVAVEIDGRSVGKDRAGSDVQWDSSGSYLSVDENRLYDIIRTGGFETHELKLTTNADDLCLYTYTFG